MAASNKINSFDQYLLKGKLRSEGYERWRYSFCASSVKTGIEKRFFVEMYLVNPSVSPNLAVIAQKSRVSMETSSSADVQYALTKGLSGYDSRYSGQEIVVKPSYLLIKAGVYGENGFQVNRFIPSSKLTYTKATATFVAENCTFAPDMLVGTVEVTNNDLRVRPELLCNEGSINWQLRYADVLETKSLFGDSVNNWIPLGVKSNFAGSITINGEEFVATPEKSFGYVDKSWGNDFSNPYFHISSNRLMSVVSNLMSVVSKKNLDKSYFTIEGEYGKEKELVGVVCVGDKTFKLGKGAFASVKETHSCIQGNSDANDERLHWSVSLEKGDYIVDLDVYCKTSELFVRDYEVSKGNRTLMKILGGGTGSGEIKVYKKTGKNLELLEQVGVYDAICEFGQLDSVES